MDWTVGDMYSRITIGEVWRLESVRRGVSRAAFRPGLSSLLAAGGGLGMEKHGSGGVAS